MACLDVDVTEAENQLPSAAAVRVAAPYGVRKLGAAFGHHLHGLPGEELESVDETVVVLGRFEVCDLVQDQA